MSIDDIWIFFNYNVRFKNKYVHNLVMRKFEFLMRKCVIWEILGKTNMWCLVIISFVIFVFFK